MNPISPAAPDDSISRILAALIPIATPVHASPRKWLPWYNKGQPQLYLFLDGQVSLLRSSDQLIIVTVCKSHLFGMTEATHLLRFLFLRVDMKSTIFRINLSQAHKIFTEQELWQDVSIFLSYITSYLCYRDALVYQKNTYSVVRNQLLEIYKLSLNGDFKTPILQYIQDRTHLSRSSILNVIANLKAGGFIKTSRGGCLIILKELPFKW